MGSLAAMEGLYHTYLYYTTNEGQGVPAHSFTAECANTERTVYLGPHVYGEVAECSIAPALGVGGLLIQAHGLESRPPLSTSLVGGILMSTLDVVG